MREIKDVADLVDIATIKVNKDLPQSERCAEFKRQLRDIHNYKCTTENETFTIRAIYANNGTSIEACLRGMMA